MNDTPETDMKQRLMYMDALECVEIDFARTLERERNCYKSAVEVITKERDEARELARDIYWAGYELRRFARAYANDYDECDGKPAAIQADHAFSEASINVAKVLGEEEAAK